MQPDTGINLFVTGTDTDVGKTMASAVLIDYMKELDFFYFKPIQTGTIKDIHLVNQLLSLHYSEEESNVYSLKAPMSPWQAAMKEKKKVSLTKITNKFAHLQTKHKNILTEGAGGLMVPLSKKIMVVDLIKKLKSQVILVVRPGLGTINHSLLSLRLLKARGIKTVGFIVNRFPAQATEIEQENPIMIEKISGVKCLGLIMESPSQDLLPKFCSTFDPNTLLSS